MPNPWTGGTTALRMLSLAVALASALLAALGLLLPGLYQDPETFIRAGWRGNDLVTLFVAMPLLLVSTRAAVRGSLAGAIVWLGVLDALVYNWAFYVFGAAPSRLMIGHIFVLALSLLTLITGLVSIDVGRYRDWHVTRGTRRYLSVYMALWALLLGVLWTTQAVVATITGEAARLNGSARAFQVTAALDLTLVVPFVALAIILLQTDHPWKVPLAGLLNVKGIVYPIVLIASSIAAHLAGVQGSLTLIPLWLAFLVASSLALHLLLRKERPAA